MISRTHALSLDEPIPYDLFQVGSTELEAQRARRMESIYHKGQDRIWDGKALFQSLMKQHGGIHVRPEHRGPLLYVLSVVMWGEYAAWRVASQLADRLNLLEARMAATSQSHDEARHFYVLHDYITAMGEEPILPRRWGRELIEMTITAEDISYKLIGMQLMIEAFALAIFNNLRESRIEPVLVDLMPYYERDEARHVGLGTQLLPETMARASLQHRAAFNAYLMKLYVCALNELKETSSDFQVLGIDPRRLIVVAKDRLFQVFRDMQEAGNRRKTVNIADGFAECLMELYFPQYAPKSSLTGRIRGLGLAAMNGIKPADRRSDYNASLRYQT
jgi:hypothetical protein